MTTALKSVPTCPKDRDPVLATHLDHRDDDTERLAAVRKIKNIISAHKGSPMILGGDLNAPPGDRVIKLLLRDWTIASADHRSPTIPADNPTRQIDYVSTHPHRHWNTIDVRVLEEPIASDHRPILAVVE